MVELSSTTWSCQPNLTDHVVTESDTVRDLGVTLDALLTMKNLVDGIAHSCFYQLWQLYSIHRWVPTDALHTLVHAFVWSLIDYCNAVLYGATDAIIRCLQAVLHAAAQLISSIQWNDQIMPTLYDTLYWLSVSLCITFKIALMTLYPWPIASVLPWHLFTDRLSSLSFLAFSYNGSYLSYAINIVFSNSQKKRLLSLLPMIIIDLTGLDMLNTFAKHLQKCFLF